MADTFRVRSGTSLGRGSRAPRSERLREVLGVISSPLPHPLVLFLVRPRTSLSPQCRSGAPPTCAVSAAWGDPALWWRVAATLPKRRSG